MIPQTALKPYSDCVLRKFTTAEKVALAKQDIPTLLNVGIKSGQGIITPRREVIQDLVEFGAQRTHAGYIPSVASFLETLAQGGRKKPHPDYFVRSDREAFEQKDPNGMLNVAYSLGLGEIPHSFAREFFDFHAKMMQKFDTNFKTLGKLIPQEISPSGQIGFDPATKHLQEAKKCL